MNNFSFANPWLLSLLILPLAILILPSLRQGQLYGAARLAAQALRPSLAAWLVRLGLVAGLTLLIFAAARPQYGRSVSEFKGEGRDLVLIIDLSYSMTADDMVDAKGERMDRLRAVMLAAEGFVKRRGGDRIGLVFFANNAISSCPPTTDHETVLDFLRRVERQQRGRWRSRMANSDHGGGLLGDGTNLGLGLGSALRLLTGIADSKGRAAILITDGRDTRELQNWIDPLETARRAADAGVKVHAIGVGNPDGDFLDPRDPFRQHRVSLSDNPTFLPDMDRLKNIVKEGRGEAQHASDPEKLEGVFRRIDELEPTKRLEMQHRDMSDRFEYLLNLGFGILLLSLLLWPWARGQR